MSINYPSTAGNARSLRGFHIALNSDIKITSKGYIVPSQSSSSKYIVTLDLGLCTCVDFEQRQAPCEHIYSRTLSEWTYWLILVGFTGFFWSLTIAGFIQGQAWLQGIPEINLLSFIRPWYIARAAFGSAIVLSGIVQAYNIYQTLRCDTRALARAEYERVLAAGYGPAPTDEGAAHAGA